MPSFIQIASTFTKHFLTKLIKVNKYSIYHVLFKLYFRTRLAFQSQYQPPKPQLCSNVIILTSFALLGTLRSNDADGNENVKKQQVLLAKQQLCTCTMLFCTFLCPFLHDYDVNMPNFAFYGGRKQATTKFYFSYCTWIWCLGIQLQEGSPTFDKVSGQE